MSTKFLQSRSLRVREQRLHFLTLLLDQLYRNNIATEKIKRKKKKKKKKMNKKDNQDNDDSKGGQKGSRKRKRSLEDTCHLLVFVLLWKIDHRM